LSIRKCKKSGRKIPAAYFLEIFFRSSLYKFRAKPAAIPITADEAIMIIGLIFFFKVKKSAAPKIAREM
jgi:hypothetical protein